jgi:hypothetical protein
MSHGCIAEKNDFLLKSRLHIDDPMSGFLQWQIHTSPAPAPGATPHYGKSACKIS